MPSGCSRFQRSIFSRVACLAKSVMREGYGPLTTTLAKEIRPYGAHPGGRIRGRYDAFQRAHADQALALPAPPSQSGLVGRNRDRAWIATEGFGVRAAGRPVLR